MGKVENILSSIRGKELSREKRIEKAITIAEELYKASKKERTFSEARRERWMAKMMSDPKGRRFMTLFTDQCYRSFSNARTADQLIYLIETMGIPRFLSEKEKSKFFLFYFLGNLFPNFFMKKIKKQLREEMATVLVPDDPKEFEKLCTNKAVELNLNHLGEAILSEAEAERRLSLYLKDFENPLITYVSIKISTLFSQINLVGWEESLHVLEERMCELYRKAGSCFVNLDMEEYKDLDLTIALFKRILSKEEFRSYYAGMVLQAYLPDAFQKLEELTSFAKERGHPIKIRLVKGANLSMELVESSLHNWTSAPFTTKEESDANYKRMLEYAMRNTDYVHLGIGSHNLFDIAYALILRAEHECEARVNFEMLSGMAQPIQRVITKLTGKMILYAPEAKAERFDHAISYLIRRLDENGGPDNFLRHFFHLSKKEIWEQESLRFKQSFSLIETLPKEPRKRETLPRGSAFSNEPDIDFSLASGREVTKRAFQKREYGRIPLVIGGKKKTGEWMQGIDPSNPYPPSYEYATATLADIEEALDRAKLPPPISLPKVAQLMRERKEELLHVQIADVGKNIQEGNGEISEAIDFLEYYSGVDFHPDYSWRPRGIILVAPPWNFSLSIPTGGIAAALQAGNAVIFKPAPEAVLVGWTLVQLFWEAGVPKESLQFLNCQEDPIGTALIKNPKLQGVVLTGATETAKKFLQIRPNLHLIAETGGKNAIIATAMCDRDLAIRDIVHSAFSYAGQKCSACSLLVLDQELYRDDRFLNQLKEATESLVVDSAWNPSTIVPPLIRPPNATLYRALTTLDAKEEWLLQPHPNPDNPHAWTPGIKLHVERGSWSHQTEFFGPVLSVMCAEDFLDAISIANGTPYGLTSGLHSLDEREQRIWKEKIQAGNLYINRNITGAIVGRQPFGGCKASSFGPGAKAGGPNYVQQLAIADEKALPTERAKLPSSSACISFLSSVKLHEEEREIFFKSIQSYAFWNQKFRAIEALGNVIGQKNLFYYVPHEKVILRIRRGDKRLDYLRVIAACLICQTPLEISAEEAVLPDAFVEDEISLQKREGRVRDLSTPVFASGRLELLHYLREVSLSQDTHRYGYLIE